MYKGDELLIEIPGFTIAARVWGEPGGLPIIAIHGWLDNASSFEFLAPLIEGAHIVAIDSPGCGHSSHRARGAFPLMHDEIFYVLQVADQLGFKDFVLMAHSRGGVLAQLIASACPQRIRALVLLDIVGFYTTVGDNACERLRLSVSTFFGPQRQASHFKDLKEAAEGRMLSSPISYESALALTKRGTEQVDGEWMWTFDRRERNFISIIRHSDEQLRQISEGIEAPTCVVLGEKGILDEKHAKERAALIRDHELHFVPGGHHVHMDDAQSVAAFVNPFLQKLKS